MTAPSETPPPAHLRPLRVEIPTTWTPEQAFAVYELISELRDAIWLLYGFQVMDERRDQRADPRPGTISDSSDEAQF
jgi:hypothetical protein